MTRFLLTLTLLTVLIFGAVLAQIQCYYGTSVQYGNSPVQGVLSPVRCDISSTYCMKITATDKRNNFKSSSYGCSDYRCTSSGCRNKGNNVQECCCRHDWCNSAPSSRLASSLLVVLATSLLYYCF